MMPKSLASLPVDILLIIVASLRKSDVLNFRATTSIFEYSSQQRFKRILSLRNMHLRDDCLVQALEIFTVSNTPGLLEDLNLIYDPNFDDPNMYPQKSETGLIDVLTRLFRSLQRLRSLRLIVDKFDLSEDPSYYKFPEDIFMFRVVTTALATSKVAIETLTMYKWTDTAHYLWSCVISYDGIKSIQPETLSDCFKSLRRLDISLCPLLTLQGLKIPAGFADKINRLFSSMQSLECLDLHFYKMDRSTFRVCVDQDQAYEFFDMILKSRTLQNLKSLCLRGSVISEASLLKFLQTATLQTLELCEVILVHGTFGSIFGLISRKDTNLQDVILNSIWEGEDLILVGDATYNNFAGKVDQHPTATIGGVRKVYDPMIHLHIDDCSRSSNLRGNWQIRRRALFSRPSFEGTREMTVRSNRLPSNLPPSPQLIDSLVYSRVSKVPFNTITPQALLDHNPFD